MKRILIMTAATVIVALAGACNHAANNHDADVQAIRDTESQWNQDYLSRDPEKLAAYYADDAVLMAPGMASVAGHENIHTLLKTMTADPALSLKFQAQKIEVAQSGDLGYSQGSYLMDFTDPQTKKVVHDHGSYVTTYRKQTDGKWKAVADIATSEVPPGAPQPAS